MASSERPDPFDPEQFLQPDFSAHAYTQHLLDQLASRQDSNFYPATSSSASNREDSATSQALSKLSLMMDHISTSIRQEVTEHYDLLIEQAEQTTATESQLTSLVEMIVSLQTSVREMKDSVRQDYDLLKTLDRRIPKLQLAADTLRRAISFLLLCRRLEIQLAAAFLETETSEPSLAALPNAALTLQTIDKFLANEAASDQVPVTKLDVIACQLPWINESREKMTLKMEDLVVSGLRDLSPSVLNDSLQTALNLGTLPSLVSDLLADLTDVIRNRVQTAFDPTALQRDLGMHNRWATAKTKYSHYMRRGGVPDEPTNEQVEAVWKRLDVLLLHDMVTVCKKVSILEKVLRFKHSGSHTLLDDVLSVLGERPSLIFWKTMADSFEKHADAAMAEIPAFQRLLEDGFMRLLSIFHEFFDRVSLYADTTYTYDRQSPEASMLMLRLKPLSKAYLVRANQRLAEAEQAAFTARGRGVPTANDGAHFARVALKELDIVPADAFLLRALVDLVPKALIRFGDDAVRARGSDTSGAPLAQGNQIRSADLASALYAVIEVLQHQQRSSQSLPLRAVLEAAIPPLEQALETQFLAPFLQTLVEQVQLPISRMTYSSSTLQSNSISPYMEDLRDRVDYIRSTLFPRYCISSRRDEIATLFVNHLLAAFVEQARFVLVPTGQYSGSVRVGADCAELEHLGSQLFAAAGKPNKLSECAAWPDLVQLRRELQLSS